jgi:hypothetical protein
MRAPTLAVPAPWSFFPQILCFWLPAVIGVLKPNRCMGINSYRYPLPCTHRCKGINPKVSPPIHSDLRSPTAYATREMRYGHIPGMGLPEPTCASQLVPCVQDHFTYVNLSGHSPCVECEDTRCIGTYLWCHVSRNSSSADQGKVEEHLCVECGHTPYNRKMYTKTSRTLSRFYYYCSEHLVLRHEQS